MYKRLKKKICKIYKNATFRTCLLLMSAIIATIIIIKMEGVGDIRLSDIIIFLLVIVFCYLAIADQSLEIADQSLEIDDQSKEKKKRIVSKKELERVACHEAGHALVARVICPQRNIKKMRIGNDKKGNLGCVAIEHIHGIQTRTDFVSEIKICLGGMVAEQVAFGINSDGCYSDLKNAINIASSMLENYGIGLRIMHGDCQGRKAREAESIVQKATEEVREILEKNKAILNNLQEELMDKRKLKQEEINSFFESHGI